MKQDLNKRFPINTNTACNSKWAWSTVWLNSGTSSSCHRCQGFKIPEEDFDSFHNLPQKIKNREDMLAGKWPGQGCEYCKKIEDFGGYSDRMHNNDIPGMYPRELDDNPTQTHVKPTIVEIFAYNTCNFRCTYCNPALSSRIEQESVKFGNHPLFQKNREVDKVKVNKRYEDFFAWLENNIQSLIRLHLLGGETLIQHDLISRVISLLERKPNPGLQLCIFSNFNPPKNYFEYYVDQIRDLWKAGNIERFDLTASIDCWGEQAQYVRNGLSLDQFKKNFEYAVSQPEDFMYLNVNQTVSSFTMKTMPDLIRYVNQYNSSRHIGHYAMLVDGYEFMRPEIFAYSQWENVWQEIYNELKTDTIEQKQTADIMKGLESVMKQSTQNDVEQIRKLYQYHDEIDRRRGTNWRQLWPELILDI